LLSVYADPETIFHAERTVEMRKKMKTNPIAAAIGPRVLCAWCNRILREGVAPASHGICPACLAGFRADFETLSPARG
jgi:hypothetical protein